MQSLPSPDTDSQTEIGASALRAAFWRYYDFLGWLTLLSVLWSSVCMLTVYGAALLWPVSPWAARVGLVLLSLAVLSAVSAGFGRAAIGPFWEGRFTWKTVGPGMKRYALRLFTLCLFCSVLGGVALTAFLFYLHWAQTATLLGYVPAFVAGSLLAAIALSSVWMIPVLFMRDDPAIKVFWRSFLLLLGHPAESLVLTTSSIVLLGLFWQAPATGLLLGAPLLLALPCTMLEKIQWGYTITFQGVEKAQVEERWRREEARGWREFFKPWEGR